MEGILGATATRQIPNDWRTFRSTLGLFSVRIPPSFRIEGGVDEGNSRVSGIDGMLTSLHEGYHFMDSAHFYAFIEAFAIKTDNDRKTYTRHRTWLSTWHGYPMFPRRGHGWFFIAADAYFGTGYQPIDQSSSQHEILDLIFASFAPTNPSLLVAPD
jgi:hypothetical protein